MLKIGHIPLGKKGERLDQTILLARTLALLGREVHIGEKMTALELELMGFPLASEPFEKRRYTRNDNQKD